MRSASILAACISTALVVSRAPVCAGKPIPPPPDGVVRVATYNVSMYRDRAGALLAEMCGGRSPQVRQIAEVLQRVRPDVVLLNEFDYDPTGPGGPGPPALVRAFRREYLEQPQRGLRPLRLQHAFYRPVNTGFDSGFDLDKDGAKGGPADAYGYGRYPGQYGMLLLSRFPIDADRSRTFQKLRWKDYPGARLPSVPETGKGYYSAAELDAFRLSSKSFWDVAVRSSTSGGDPRWLHMLCSHPTPPSFDGPEDRNGKRNYDEIGMVAAYLDSAAEHPRLFRDDTSGRPVTFDRAQPFVVLGDLNADPVDGGGTPGAIRQLLDHRLINGSVSPRSEGGVAASRDAVELNRAQRGDPAHDTADFGGDGYSNLRVDYALPSKQLRVIATGVFWPRPGEPGSEAVRATDHRLVWIDVKLPDAGAAWAP
ncbi:MAG: endonuclease/exonuclease/phosphatase family protein [Planctomycetota bacterium]